MPGLIGCPALSEGVRELVRCGEAAQHSAGHGQIQHGFLVIRLGFVVAHAAVILADPAEGPLGDPDPGAHVEPAHPEQSLDDLHRQREHAVRPTRHEAVGVYRPLVARGGLPGRWSPGEACRAAGLTLGALRDILL